MLSTDAEIVKLAGQTIPQIVEQYGWEYFRDLETEICQGLAGKDGLALDTGGGAILRPQNVDMLKRMGKLFWLTASVETIAKRIGSDTQRPSLTGTKSFIDEIQDVLRERAPKYQAAADHVIETEGKFPSRKWLMRFWHDYSALAHFLNLDKSCRNMIHVETGCARSSVCTVVTN